MSTMAEARNPGRGHQLEAVVPRSSQRMMVLENESLGHSDKG